MIHDELLPGLRGPAPKAFRDGTHRLVAPAATVARVRRFMPVMGITRIANITGLDYIGIPVVMVCRPNARSISVSQGKGLDLDAARASGLMESIETYHAETITRPLKLASYEELRYTHRVADVARLPRPAHSLFHPHLAILWIEGYDLIQREPVWVAYEVVHMNYTVAMRAVASCFIASSNGLASGNHLLEAISHGLCEAVERDATTLWQLMSAEAREQTRIDLETVTDSSCRAVLEHYVRAGISVAAWEITSDIGIPAFKCQIVEQAHDPLRRLYVNDGMGCHPDRGVALLRALTEAAQSRLTLISGARDDCFRHEYEHLRSPDLIGQHQAQTFGQPAARRFACGPSWEGETFDEDVAWELERLLAAGIERAIVVDLTRPEFRIPVVRVIVPGLESLAGADGYLAGARAQARRKGST
jgi:ribosomal protein S12 methylthiotransferase accessory factor